VDELSLESGRPGFLMACSLPDPLLGGPQFTSTYQVTAIATRIIPLHSTPEHASMKFNPV
jgi:hypothetical protein